MRKTPRASAFLRGSALLIVLWAVAMMSMTVLGVVEYVHYDLEETTSLEKDFRVRQLAEAGVAIGMHPLITKRDSLLSQTMTPDEKFQVYLRSEGSRLNINTIVQGQQWQILHDLCVVWGLKESDAADVASDFQTWTQAEKWAELTASQSRVSGFVVTSHQQGTLLPSHVFQSIEEMLLIPGMKLLAGAQPEWRNYFTIWSDGGLDMNEASADLIAAVCGIGEAEAQRFVNVRLGPDGKADTEDDVIYQNMDQVRQSLGMSANDFQRIQGRLSLQDSVTRIESNGIVGTYQRKIMVVVRRASTPPVYLQWQEL